MCNSRPLCGFSDGYEVLISVKWDFCVFLAEDEDAGPKDSQQC